VLTIAVTIRKCDFCGAEFKSYNPKPRYCSRSCKDDSQKHHVPIESIIRLYEKGHTQTEVAEILGTTQKVIYKRMKDIGYTARIAAKRNQTRDRNSYWRGGRVSDGKGYIYVKSPGHPRAKRCGDYVREHIVVVENFIGRHLEKHEIVHHINGIKHDNRPENLYITDAVEHVKLHNSKTAHLVESNLQKYKEAVAVGSI